MGTTLQYVAVLLTLTAIFAYINHYVLKLPRNSGLLVIALLATMLLRLAEAAFPEMQIANVLRRELDKADLGPLLLNVFLGFMLFSGALDVNVRELLGRKWTILALATVGVLLSTAGMGAGMYGIFRMVGLEVPLAYCLVFGALVSPTDPVTVLGVLRRLGIQAPLEAVIAGESLFNDGVGIVLYTILLQVAVGSGGGELSAGSVALHFLQEAFGGAALGLATGGLAFIAMRGIDDYSIELMITVALVTGTYALAQSVHVSGPVAIVVAGLLMGSIGRRYAVSDTTHDYLHKFWLLTDELLNALLFLLIGFEFATIELAPAYIAVAALAIPLALMVRAASITLAGLPLNLGTPNKLRVIALLTWSGLRGGISVALAISLPRSPHFDALVTACYAIVIFTMIVQGLSLGRVAARLYPKRGV
jgi:CPA1 family monovalent cation:H+ antiporter